MSNTAYIYDAVRTPRSKGKPGGTLHEVKPIDLGAGVLRALQERNDLDTSYVDDVIMPHSTRKRVARSLAMLRNKSVENPWRKHGNIPL